MATEKEARKVLQALPEEERKSFIQNFNKLESDEDRKIVLDRLVSRSGGQAAPEQPQERPSLGEQIRGKLPSSVEDIEESIRRGAQAAPAVGQVAGGIAGGILSGGPSKGLGGGGIIRRAAPVLKNIRGALPVARFLGATDIAGAVGAVAGRAAGQEYKLQAEEAPLPTVGREIIAPTMSAAGLPGAAIGASQIPRIIDPEKRMEALKDIGVTAAIEVGMLGGLRSLKLLGKTPPGRFFTKKIPDLVRGLGGVYRETVRQAKRIGPERLKKVADFVRSKSGAGYFTEELVPRVQKGIIQITNNFTDDTGRFLNELGVSPKSVRRLQKVGIKSLRNVRDKFVGGFDEMAEGINLGLKDNLRAASDVFDTVLNKSKQPLIKAKGTFFKLQDDLMEIGAINNNGARTSADFGSTTINKLIDIYDDMRQFVISGGRTEAGKVLPKSTFTKQQYNRFLLRLEDALSGNNKVDRFVYNALTSLRKDATKSVKGLKHAMKLYSKAKTNLDEGFEKVGKILKRKKINLDERRLLERLDNDLPKGKKFLTDFDNFKAAEEVVPAIDKSLDAVTIEKNLSSFSGFKKPGLSQINNTKRMLSFLPDKEISDDALAFFLVDDLFQETLPAGFGGAAGVSRSAFEAATRGGIRVAEPSVGRQTAKGVAGRLSGPMLMQQLVQPQRR